MKQVSRPNTVDRATRVLGAALVSAGVSAIGLLGVMESADATNVHLGSDYLQTPPGSGFDFGPGIGQVTFQGRPVGPGLTDTIIQRQQDAIFDDNNDGILERTSTTINIEMTLLSLESVNSVNVDGSQFGVPSINGLFDVFVSLTPSTNSAGTMTINHNSVGGGFDDSGLTQGTFTSDFNVFFDALFTPVGGGSGAFTISDSLRLVNSGADWSHTPPSGAQLVRGAVGDQNANCHELVGPGCNPGDFFTGIDGDVVRHTKPDGSPFDNHTTETAEVAAPEPTTTLGSVMALGFGAFLRRKISQKGKGKKKD